MDSKWKSIISIEEMPRIHAVARDGLIQGAIGSLTAWGAINIGAWFLLGSENRGILQGLKNPSGSIYMLTYWTLVLGIVMLGFAAVGQSTRHRSVIVLSGISLITVGLSNVSYDFVAMNALKPYGYTVEKPATFWIVLGAVQVIWGVREINKYRHLSSWSNFKLAKSELKGFKNDLKEFAEKPEEPEAGILKSSITTPGPLGLSFLSKTARYTGRITDDVTLMISDKLDDCFVMDRRQMGALDFEDDGKVQAYDGNGWKEMVLSAPSSIQLKVWSGVPVSVADINRLRKTKTGSMSLLRSFLAASDNELRAASVSALESIHEFEIQDEIIGFFDDPAPEVKAAAIDACRSMKIEAAQSNILAMISYPAPVVRIAALRYFAVCPTQDAGGVIDELAARESDDTVKKQIKKTKKALRREGLR